MKAKKIIKAFDICGRIPAFDDFEVQGISCNSKEVSENFIFVAIKGTREDGAKFIKEAAARGARLVVTQLPADTSGLPRNLTLIAVKDARRALADLAAEFYAYPSSRIKVVGVTGTNGKTTITYLLEALLKKAGNSPAVIGTVNYRFKNKIIPSKNTTPGPIQLQALLAEMAREGLDFALMEVSSHALDQQRAGGVDFHSAIFTNLTQDHLDYHRDMESYFRAKAKLFENLKPSSFAVLNYDDAYARRLKSLTRARVISYGIEEKADLGARILSFDCRGTRFLLSFPQGEIEINTALIGRHNIYNLLAAAAWGYQAGISVQVIKSALGALYLVPGRLERIDGTNSFSVFVDYAHTQDALKNTITALRQLCQKKIIVVFGCGGERDKTKRPKMGEVAAQLSDYAIITSDNPRSEEPQAIIKDIEKGIASKNYCIIPERREAIRKSLALAREGDIVLIAGKGHEDYQILKDRRIHFDDREVVRECLRQTNY